MSRYVREFGTLHPQAHVRLEYLHPERVLESVEDGSADLGIVSYPRGTRSIQAEPWREEPLVLVCAPSHPLAGEGELAIAALDGLPMVGFDPDLVIRHEIDRLLAAEGVEPLTVLAFDNIETIKRAVEIDAGVSILPEPTVQREVAAGTLACLPIAAASGTQWVRPLGIIRGRGRHASPTVQRFIDLLHGHAHDLDSPATVAATAT